MFQGLTRQEQRTLLALLGIIVVGLAIHQWRGGTTSDVLVIDAASERTLVQPVALLPREGSAASPASSLIDINTASVTELTSLPGIGEVRARSIIDHREASGPFARVDDITQIGGIGDATLARLQPLITVSSSAPPVESPPVEVPRIQESPPSPVAASTALPTAAFHPVNINTASLEELMTLPDVGEVIGQRIIDHRRTHGPFRRPSDLEAIPRIGPRTVERLTPLITF
jgi:competence protein ComEA